MVRRRMALGMALAILAATQVMGQPPAQQEAPVYTYVAEWEIPRARWADFTQAGERSYRPVFERLARDGTLVAWGVFDTYVHHKGESTHGIWWTSANLAGIERARAELLKMPPSPAIIEASQHRDYLLRSMSRRSRPTGPQSGVLMVSNFLVPAGKEQEFRELGEKFSKPILDEMLANGTISLYQVDVEHVHTERPGMWFIAYVAPNIDAVDKVNAAFRAAEMRRTPEERRTMMQSMTAATTLEAHRDFLALVSSYQTK